MKTMSGSGSLRDGGSLESMGRQRQVSPVREQCLACGGCIHSFFFFREKTLRGLYQMATAIVSCESKYHQPSQEKPWPS